jgi:hypothetical protein
MFKTIDLNRLALGLVAAYALVLALGFGREPGFLIGPQGKPLHIEFVGVRAAGELTLEGRAAAAYDWAAHTAKHREITRQTNDDYYPWPYPPPYLAVAALLALMPYLASALVWIAATLVFQIVATVRAAGNSRAALWLLAAPPTFVNLSVAHTGFLAAGLLTVALHSLVTSPLAAGVAFGLLAFKPQLGLMIPIALAAGGHWRAIAAAAGTILAACLASIAAFGVEPWLAFPGQLDHITDIFRFERTNMRMLVSVYGLGRTLGLDHVAALVPQVFVTVAAGVVVFRLWRSHVPQALKAAGLIVASLVASPYLYVYDLTLLVAALVFLARAAGDAGFDDTETLSIAALGAVVFAYTVTPVPAGVIANAIAAALVWRRYRVIMAPAGDAVMAAGSGGQR